jgi:hypothetical protein
MQEILIDFKKSNFIINNEQHNLFDLPIIITSLKNLLEERLPIEMEVEKGILLNQLSVFTIQSQNLILSVKKYWESLGIFLN